MRKFLLYIFLIITVAPFVSSCEKEEKTTKLPSLDEYLSSQTDLSIFKQAIEKAGLQSFKDGPGPFTWLAPTNAAFTAAGITADSINKMTQGAVNYLVMYHLINGSVPTLEMIANNSFPRGTLLGNTGSTQVFLGRKLPDYFVNGSKITSPDNNLSNGVVHIINRVNIPPALVGNVQTILTTSGKHSLFIAALTKANRWTQFAGTSTFTILAPTDEAMIANGYTAAAITAATVPSIDSLVRYHYFNSLRLFSNDFNNSLTPQTALGATKTILAVNDGTKLKGQKNSAPVDIVGIDRLGVNGVVHTIGGVLKP